MPKLLFLIFLPLCFTIKLSAEPEIKIGAILPLSGDAQAFGQEARLALEHALADTPSKKFQYKLLFEDDQMSPAKASLAAKKLSDLDGAKIVFSNWSYGGNAVASALKNQEVLNLAFAWDPKIIDIGKNNFIIAAAPENLAEKIILKIKSEGRKSIILIGFQEAGVEFAFNALEQFAKQNGVQVLKRIETNPTVAADFRSLLMQIKSAQPEYLVTCLIYPQMLELLKQMKTLQVDLPVASIGQAPFGQDFKTVLPKTWWTVDYLATPSEQAKILKRTGLNDLSGYPSYYEALRAIINIFEQSPTGEVPNIETLVAGLEAFQREDSLLGKIRYQSRRFYSDNVTVLDQLLRY